MNTRPVAATDGRPIEGASELLASLATETRIAFDLDGTLFDARDFERPALAAVVAWLREKSGRALPDATARLWSRRERDRHVPGLFNELLESEGLPVAWGEECREQFHAHEGIELETTPSLRGELGSFRARGSGLALVSNGPPALQQRKLERLGLLEYFDEVVFCDPRIPSLLKPSPWAWSQLERWRGDGRAAYVGDDPVDAGFAAAGGARFIPFRFRNPAYAD